MRKDYYKILEVSANATDADIKKSYRRLALQHHPDKNNGNQLSEARFKEIQEAYRVLSNETRRKEYNYSIPNSYTSSNTSKKQQPPASANSILSQTIDFKKKVTTLDPYRMNKLAVFQQIQIILSGHNIKILQQQSDAKINKKIIDDLLVCARYLSYVQVEKICFQLAAIAGTDNVMNLRIYNFSKQARLNTFWNKYKFIVAMIAAIIICLLIFLLSETSV